MLVHCLSWRNELWRPVAASRPVAEHERWSGESCISFPVSQVWLPASQASCPVSQTGPPECRNSHHDAAMSRRLRRSLVPDDVDCLLCWCGYWSVDAVTDAAGLKLRLFIQLVGGAWTCFWRAERWLASTLSRWGSLRSYKYGSSFVASIYTGASVVTAACLALSGRSGGCLKGAVGIKGVMVVWWSPTAWQYVGCSHNLFITSIKRHNLETRQSNNLYIPQTHFSIHQKGAYYLGIKIFNQLPSNIKNANGNIAIFKTTLKKIICMNSFYLLKEYFDQ